ncbi:FecR family protein [Aquimarina litoralis]|uniref:FecR family protein n=1 Tax=Aquimarina litoralis TaxID=584605 RepID=UPI001C598B8F|nr:FecR family protein [Aquimarina litoralis]MBW1294280.1 DUF4974 domain-containing protein [Aquimarina litoralis]
MKQDKDLLKELLQSKFKDDTVASSGDNFDLIFDAVQEKSDDKSLLYWYAAGIILLMSIGVFTIYYFKNIKPSKQKESTTEIQIQKEENTSTPIVTDSIINKKEKKNLTNKDTITKPSSLSTISNKENQTSKKIDVTTLAPEDEIIEKGVITVTYTASNKYASTKKTKYNQLPDSSTIVVRKNSKVNFTATKQGFRRADINGTVFFNVKDNSSQPFIIFGKHCKVQVSGNSFAIHSDSSADIMTLIQGSAKVVDNNSKTVKELTPGESLKVDKNGISLLQRAPNQFAWKTKKLHYNNTLVNQVIQDLGDNYDAKIILKNRDILNCKYSGSFDNANIPRILKKLTTSLKLQLSKEEDIFVITGKGCQ